MPIDQSHGLLLAAFQARENGDADKLQLLGKLAENPELAGQIVAEAEQLAVMHGDDDEGGAPGKPSATFLG